MEYKIHISQFDGPLDLLLHLIEKAELDIKDVFVSEITSEFLKFIDQLDELDMEQASSFISVAATLLYMKSRSLFPTVSRQEESEKDPGELLIRQLKEYKVFKQASETMRLLAHNANSMYSKLPEEFPVPPPEILLKNTTVQRLFDAMLAAIRAKENLPQNEYTHEVTADEFTIRSCSKKIRYALRVHSKGIKFSDIIHDASKGEIIVTFMALLEMIADGEIRLLQKSYCDEIEVYALNLVCNDETMKYSDEEGEYATF